jgi:hypothetical protein
MGIALADAAYEEGEADDDQHSGDSLDAAIDGVIQESPSSVSFSPASFAARVCNAQ